jgi:tetratricopeptide (TPR) repeat protein
MQKNHLKAVILTSFHATEYPIVRSYLEACREVTVQQGTVYDLGSFSTPEVTWDILLGQVGAGNIESAIEAERAITSFQPSLVLSLGLAYGLQHVQPGDVVAVTKAYHYECGQETAEGFTARPEVNQSTYPMLQRAGAEARNVAWQRMLPVRDTVMPTTKVHLGPLASGEKEVIFAPRFLEFLQRYYNDTLALDRSSSGFLGAARAMTHVEALIVRGITAPLSTEASSVAAYHACAFAFTVLARLQPCQFSSSLVSTDPLVELEKLANGGASAFSIDANDRNITIYPAISIKNASDKFQKFFDDGNKYFKRNLYKDAIKSYNSALKCDKNNIRALNNKGLAYFLLGEHTKALEAYANAIKHDPNYAEAYSNQAAVFYKLRNYSKAQASYQQAINLYKCMEQQPDNAEKSELCSHMASAFTGLGDVLYALGEYQQAKSYYTCALRQVASKASAYIGRGNCFVKLERFAEALSDYKRAMRYDPSNAAAYRGQGQAYEREMQWKKALNSYEQALLLKANDAAEIYCAVGTIYLRLQDYESALDAFKKFHQLCPDALSGYRYLIATQGKLQCYEEVLRLCAEASQRFPADDWIAVMRQRALLEREQRQQSIEMQNTTILSAFSLSEHNIHNNVLDVVRARDSSTSHHRKKKVFISYAQQDAKWLKRLYVHLEPLEREGIIELWDDTKIVCGMPKQSLQSRAIETARVAIALLSSDFFASEPIVLHELPLLLSYAAHDRLAIMPLIVSPCTFSSSALASFQPVNDPGKPLSRMNPTDRDWTLMKLAQAVKMCVTTL